MKKLRSILGEISKDGRTVDVVYCDTCCICGQGTNREIIEDNLPIDIIVKQRSRGYVENGKYHIMHVCHDCLILTAC